MRSFEAWTNKLIYKYMLSKKPQFLRGNILY